MEEHPQGKQCSEERKAETIDHTKEPQTSIQENSQVRIAFLGNVDSGKSTICQGLLTLTGAIDKEKLAEMKKEYPYSNIIWIRCLTDQLPEPSSIILKTPERELDILNSFIGTRYWNFRYLLKVLQHLEALCIVVSASMGEFEAGFGRGGCTRQLLKIAAVVGISRLIIIVNKMDDRTICWAQERYQEIKDEITRFLNKKLRFDQSRVDWIPVSGLSKENIMAGIAHPSGSWYKGPTLLKLLSRLPISTGNLSGPTRVGVSEKFKEGDKTRIMGEVQSGILTKDQEMILIPSLQKVTIKEISSDQDESLSLAKPGEAVKITIEADDKQDIIGLSSDMPTICSEIECEITTLEFSQNKSVLTTGSEFTIHLNGIVQEAWITSVQSEYDEKENTYKKTSFLKAWSKGVVHIALKDGDPMYCEKFSVFPKLGKFFLCGDEPMPIAYGTILRIKPIKNSQA